MILLHVNFFFGECVFPKNPGSAIAQDRQLAERNWLNLQLDNSYVKVGPRCTVS